MNSPKLTDRVPLSARVRVEQTVLDAVAGKYDEGLYLDAFEASIAAGPLQAWTGAEALVLATRLAANLGGGRLSRLLALRAWREHPLHAGVRVQYGYSLLERGDLMGAWRHAESLDGLEALTDERHADLLALRAGVAADFRDHSTAGRLLKQAMEVRPVCAWMLAMKFDVLMAEERRHEALAALDEALVLKPWNRPVVQRKARLLHVLGRLDEAVAFLTEAMTKLQSCGVALQLTQLMRDAGDEQGRLRVMDEVERLSPLAPELQRKWLEARRADAWHALGNREAAAQHAELAGEGYYTEFAGRLRAAEHSPARRVRLPVAFVAQGYLTCGPATLAALVRYFGSEATQESIVGAICYDGTYDHQERSWCLAAGFYAREFTVTWEGLKAVIDAGLPFALATVEVGSAHLQAVTGYDELRETLFIQDPGEPHFREVVAKEFLDEYLLTGPRGMIVAPLEMRERVDGLGLQDASLYDLHYQFQMALSGHRRAAAVQALEEMTADEPRHRLVLLSKLSLAAFDMNRLEQAKLVDELLELFPEDARVLNWKLSALRDHGSREQRLELLQRGSKLKSGAANFLKELALEQVEDHRQKHQALRMLKEVHRGQPGKAETLRNLGDWYWLHDRTVEVLDYYRFAASLEDKNEGLAFTWFQASMAFGRSGDALEWLRRRSRDYGEKSSGPVITLALVLDRLCRTPESLAELDQGLERRPKDGELLIQLAKLKSRTGMAEEAAAHLEEAKAVTQPARWLRVQAALHQLKSEWAEAMSCWHRVLEQEPLALDAHRELVSLMAATGGVSAALKHLEESCERFPYHQELGQLRVMWLKDEDLPKAEAAARALIVVSPLNGWSKRELALILSLQGRLDEALKWSREVLETAVKDAQNHGVHAHLLGMTGEEEEAARHWREAVRMDVNYGWAYDRWLNLMGSTQQKREVLDFIRAEMVRQVLNGEALHAYRGAGFGIVETKELAAQLREVWEARPDLWEAWSVLAAQEIDAGNTEEAMKLAAEATEKFPLLPGAWRDLAIMHRLKGDFEAAIAANRRVLGINPDWTQGWMDLSGYLEDSGKSDEAVAVLESAVQRLPLETRLRMRLANSLYWANRNQQAWEVAAAVVVEEPTLIWAWQQLRQWAPALQREDDLVNLARQVTQERPGKEDGWLALAEVLPASAVEEKLQAIDEAIRCSPRSDRAYELKVVMLADLGRWNAAEKVFQSVPWPQERMPLSLQGRRIWLRAVKGELKDALAEMLALLETNTDYYWGWECVSEWARYVGNQKAWQMSAKEMVRLAPRDASSFCYAADVELQLGNKKEAEGLFKRALSLDPGTAYAAMGLLDLYWARHDIEGLKSLSSLTIQGGKTRWIAMAAQAMAAIRRKDQTAVKEHLAAVIRMPTEYDQLADWLSHHLFNQAAVWHHLYVELLAEAVKTDEIGSSFGVSWILDETRKGKWNCWEHFSSWRQRMGRAAVASAAAYLDKMGEIGRSVSGFDRFIQEHGDWLRQEPLLWGKVGFVMTQSQDYEKGIAWLKDGEKRPGTEGWMMFNLLACYLDTNRFNEASELSLRVVQKGLRDHTWGLYVAQAGLGLAMKQQWSAAREMLLLTEGRLLENDWKVRHALASSMCQLEEAASGLTRGKLKSRFKGELNKLRSVIGQTGPATPAMQNQYREAVKQMSEIAGTGVPWRGGKYPGSSNRDTKGRPVAVWMVIAIVGIFAMRAVSLVTSSSSSSAPSYPAPTSRNSDHYFPQPSEKPWRVESGSHPYFYSSPTPAPSPSLQKIFDEIRERPKEEAPVRQESMEEIKSSPTSTPPREADQWFEDMMKKKNLPSSAPSRDFRF